MSSSSYLALFLLCGAVETAAVLSFGVAEVRPRQGCDGVGDTLHRREWGMEPQAGMHRHASKVLEMGRLERGERNSWRKRAGQRRAVGLRRAEALGAEWGQRC